MSRKALSGFKNSSYFIFPLKIKDRSKFLLYLDNHSMNEKPAESQKNENIIWERISSGFDTNYLMFYADNMKNDGRFRRYTYVGQEKPNIYMFDDEADSPDKSPALGEISLYVFGQKIIFLEFQVLYKNMEPKEIAYFISIFRSLRHSKDVPAESGCKSLKDAIEKIMPARESGTILCFSNPSEVKMQADIFTMLSIPGLDEQESRSLCCRLAHGYKTIDPSEGDASSDYDKFLQLNANEHWGICPDGLAYINNIVKAKNFFITYNNLCNDYHFIYLLLLHQRFSAISFIEEISRIGKSDKEREKITEIYPNIVDLRTHYSFRVISDNFFYQTVYNTTYQVLEIESLLKDLEEANGQFNELSKEREKRVERFIGVLSLLAAFSAVTDLAAYLCEFTLEMPFVILKVISLVVVLLILAWAYFKHIKPKKR